MQEERTYEEKRLEAYKKSLRREMRDVMGHILVKDVAKVKESRKTLRQTLDALKGFDLYGTPEVTELEVMAREYLFVIKTYLKQDINTDFVETLDELPFSMLILETVRDHYIKADLLARQVLRGVATDEQEASYTETFGRLLDEDLIVLEETGHLRLGKMGERLFKTYSATKSLTNKYERVRRTQVDAQPKGADVNLLGDIEVVEGGFAILDLLYHSEEGRLTNEQIQVGLNGTLVGGSFFSTLKSLNGLDLIEGEVVGGVPLMVVTARGRKVFETYKKSKQYTNKYEKVRRVAQKMLVG